MQATCNKVIIIHHGRIVAQDTIDQIEKMNQGSFLVNIKTRKSSDLSDTLKKLNGVISVEKITDLHFQVKMQENDELIDNIANEVIKSGAGLMELVPTRANLEDVFLKLTYGNG